MERIETPIPVVIQIVTGHFLQGKGYTNWREHGTADWLLILTLSGKGRFGYQDGEYTAQAGDITLLKPHTLHDYGVDTSLQQWELIWAHFHPRPHWHTLLDWTEVAPGLLSLSLQSPALLRQVESVFAKTDALARGAMRRKEEFAMNALEEVLLWCDAANPRSEQARLDGRVQEAMNYMCQHIAEDMSLEHLADISNLSVSRLAHLFRQQVGVTPLQFLEQQRLDRAAQLLEVTSRPIQSIAGEVGFDNPFYFSLRFKRHVGYCPRDYRRLRQDGDRSI
ncbi:AraC family transcriptional regulator [Armatimonadota bacterium]|nr:AraC family transcriptional regulator [Armatimonadota bacterium]